MDALYQLSYRGLVQGEGFEPPKAKPTDLQSVVFDRFTIPAGVLKRAVEPMTGIEPATRGLQNRCSTS